MFLGSSQPFGAKLIWKTPAPPRVKFFWWLVMHGRCWTADRRFRHGLQESNSCALCDQAPETLDHLLLQCPFARELWTRCLRSLHLQHRVKVQEGAVLDWWISSRKHIPKEVRKGFDSLFFLVGWLIWKERNARTFNGVSKSPAIWKDWSTKKLTFGA